MSITDLKIDMEFASKIPPLTGEELMRLHESILTEGRCISPIVVWNGVIVDGHNRYRFLSRHPEIEYAVYEKDFLDRNDAIAWICKNQLGRRNLTPEQKKYLIGKQYEAEKQSLGGDRKSEAAKSMYQNETLFEGENTGERIARENNVSRISVIRAEKYANAVDLAEEAVPGIKDEILSGAIHATDTEIIKIAQAAPDKRLAIVEKLRQPKQLKPKAVRTKGITFNKKYYENPEELVPSSRPDKEPPISAVLVELGAVVDDFMFRWEFQQETNGQLFQKEECLEGVRKLITQMNDYLGELESKFGKSE